MKFNVNHNVKDFKNVDSFLASVYAENPIIAKTGYTLEVFTNQTKAIQAVYGGTIKGAIKRLANTSAFTPYAERAKTNIVDTLRKFGVYKQLSTLNRDVKGRFKGFDKAQLNWDNTRGGYVYMGKYLIDVSNSPENVSIVKM